VAAALQIWSPTFIRTFDALPGPVQTAGNRREIYKRI
jgi:hypothetical protein